jgi:hypothetical protein
MLAFRYWPKAIQAPAMAVSKAKAATAALTACQLTEPIDFLSGTAKSPQYISRHSSP